MTIAHAAHNVLQIAAQSSLGSAESTMTQSLAYTKAITPDTTKKLTPNLEEFNALGTPTRLIEEYKQLKLGLETFAPYWGLDILLKNVMGAADGPTQQGATAAYKQTFKFQQELSALFTAILGYGNQTHVYEGCVVNKLALSAAAGNDVKANFECLVNAASFSGSLTSGLNPVDIDNPEIINFDHLDTGDDDCGIFLWTPGAEDTEQGNLSFDSDKLVDDAQDFTAYQTASGDAAYAVIVYGDSGADCCWGYCGAIDGATKIAVYEERSLTTPGFNGTKPGTIESYKVVSLPTASDRIDAKEFTLTIDNHLTDENMTAGGRVIPRRSQKSPEVTLELSKIVWDEGYGASGDMFSIHQNKTPLRGIMSFRGSQIEGNYYNEFVVYFPYLWVMEFDAKPESNGIITPKVTLKAGRPHKDNDDTLGTAGEPWPLFKSGEVLANPSGVSKSAPGSDITHNVAVVTQNRQSS